jgi:tetratricopeptide (TPR) repeat protein
MDDGIFTLLYINLWPTQALPEMRTLVLYDGGAIYNWVKGGLAVAGGEEGASPEKQMFDRGMKIAAKGKFDEAITWFDEITRMTPESVYGWFGLGVVMKKKNDLDRAVQYFDHAIDVDPGFPGAWHEKGHLHQVAGDIDGAIECFSRAIAADPTYADGWFSKGDALEKKGWEHDDQLCSRRPSPALTWRLRSSRT